MSEYIIRRFEPGDREGFLDLYDVVFGGGSAEWFAWKYEDNPYLEEPPIFVAETDGELVGARPFLAYRMRAGDCTYVALQTGDTMVHPDHRRRGLFTRMTSQAYDHYADREPVFTFNVPNALSRPGYLKLGCEVVSELTTYHRVQDPAALADANGVVARLATATGPLARGYLRLRDTVADGAPEVTVARHVDLPVETLASLYRRRPPEAIHAYRDEQFFEYRFENPRWEYSAYTARLGGSPVAGVVAGTRAVDGHTVTTLVDVVPLVGDDERDRGLAGLLDRVIEDHADSAVVSFRGTSVPETLLHRFGFHADRTLPLSLVTTPTVLIACPLPTDGEWRIQGRNLTATSSWLPTFAEQNSS